MLKLCFKYIMVTILSLHLENGYSYTLFNSRFDFPMPDLYEKGVLYMVLAHCGAKAMSDPNNGNHLGLHLENGYKYILLKSRFDFPMPDLYEKEVLYMR